jgi:hypothetical protein
VILAATILSIMMISARPTSSSLPSVAFALELSGYYEARNITDEDKNSNNTGDADEDESNITTYPIAQSAKWNAGNFNLDNKLIAIEQCEDANIVINDNSQVGQTDIQFFEPIGRNTD